VIAAGQIFVIGDSHIGLSEGSEKSIIGWLDRFATLRPRALYLNGDLFHYLIAHPKFYTSSVDKVFARFRELRDSGIGIHYVEGNRDFFLKGSFAEDAVTDVALEYAVAAGDKKFLIVHGDMINDRDWPYRFWRSASKNPVSKFALKLIPGRTARKFVDGVEKKLAKTNFKHKSQLPLQLMESYGERRSEEGYTHIVFGHFHEKLVLPTDTATITILPPWYETGEAMAIDPVTGAFDWVSV
jgi:UDP-2,3-diacylglucosamine hydrolase